MADIPDPVDSTAPEIAGPSKASDQKTPRPIDFEPLRKKLCFLFMMETFYNKLPSIDSPDSFINVGRQLDEDQDGLRLCQELATLYELYERMPDLANNLEEYRIKKKLSEYQIQNVLKYNSTTDLIQMKNDCYPLDELLREYQQLLDDSNESFQYDPHPFSRIARLLQRKPASLKCLQENRELEKYMSRDFVKLFLLWSGLGKFAESAPSLPSSSETTSETVNQTSGRSTSKANPPKATPKKRRVRTPSEGSSSNIKKSKFSSK
ncbi:unnamed protein product [Caenorhabditis brenneri]